jgi:hypothetical protein
VRDRLASFEERQSAVRKHMFDKMENPFRRLIAKDRRHEALG